MKLHVPSRCLLAVAVSMGGSAYAQDSTFTAISRLITTNASGNQLRVLDLDDIGHQPDNRSAI